MMSSVATTPITGVVGARVSTMRTLAPAVLAFPATSVATALMVLSMASLGTSALLKLTLQAPALAVTTLVRLPQVKATLASTSAVPVTMTPSFFSAELTVSSVATRLTTGVAVTVSRVKRKAADVALLPAASV